MVRHEAIRHIREQPRSIVARRHHQLLERPRFTGLERKVLGVDDRPHRRAANLKPPTELRAGRERIQRRVSARRREREQPVVGAGAFGRRDAVVLRVGVLTEVDRRAESAAGLRQHLKPFAVQRGRWRQRQVDVEEHDLLDAHRNPAAIDHTRSTERVGPVAYQFDPFGAAAVARHHGAWRLADRLAIQQLRQRNRRQPEEFAPVHGRAPAPARAW